MTIFVKLFSYDLSFSHNTFVTKYRQTDRRKTTGDRRQSCHRRL